MAVRKLSDVNIHGELYGEIIEGSDFSDVDSVSRPNEDSDYTPEPNKSLYRPNISSVEEGSEVIEHSDSDIVIYLSFQMFYTKLIHLKVLVLQTSRLETLDHDIPRLTFNNTKKKTYEDSQSDEIWTICYI